MLASGYVLSLAVVPPCAGECRLVRVIGVLIFANSRTCVSCVLPAAGPLGRRADARLRTGGLARDSKTSCRDSHRPVGRPVAPGAIAEMTLRNEQSVHPTPQTTHIDYLRLTLGRLQAASERRCSSRPGHGGSSLFREHSNHVLSRQDAARQAELRTYRA